MTKSKLYYHRLRNSEIFILLTEGNSQIPVTLYFTQDLIFERTDNGPTSLVSLVSPLNNN